MPVSKLAMIAFGVGWWGRGVWRHPRLWRWLMRFTMSPLLSCSKRAWILRAIGVDIARTAYIADNVFIGSPLVTFGEKSGCSVDCFFDGAGRIDIGDNVRLGARCVILTSSHPIEHDVIRRDLSKPTIPDPVRIGRGSWLCSNVTVVPGVDIGEGCVVAAGAIVAGDLAPNGLYAGAPARRIRDLPVDEAERARAVRTSDADGPQIFVLN